MMFVSIDLLTCQMRQLLRLVYNVLLIKWSISTMTTNENPTRLNQKVSITSRITELRRTLTQTHTSKWRQHTRIISFSLDKNVDIPALYQFNSL